MTLTSFIKKAPAIVAIATCSASTGLWADSETSASPITAQTSKTIAVTDMPEANKTVYCEYRIENDWGNGALAKIRLENDGIHPINNWELKWRYEDGSTIDSSWNVKLNGDTSYTAKSPTWKGRLSPGQAFEFGLVINNATGKATAPTFEGALCQKVFHHLEA